MGQVFQLLGANGATMVPISPTGLKRGQVVSYSNIATPHQKAVVVEDIGNQYGQRVLFVDDLRYSQCSQTSIDSPGGWEDEHETMPESFIVALEQKAAEQQKQEQSESEARIEKELQAQATGKARFDSLRPTWAKAAIVAIQQIDKSDSMTDYFATTRGTTVFLAWSKTNRNNFAEMRKAAATFKETQHLGPGCNICKKPPEQG